jgi:hypothetical protein
MTDEEKARILAEARANIAADFEDSEVFAPAIDPAPVGDDPLDR